MKPSSFRSPVLPLPVAAPLLATLVFTLVLGTSGQTHAQSVKENNADALNLSSSWVGGSIPGSTEIAQWNSQVTGANTADLGAATSWLGIRILNPAGAVTVTGTSPNTLTLGASGIDMSNATQNLTLSAPVMLASAQTWNVAAGRILRIGTAGTGSISGTGPLTINGPGQVRIGGLASTYTFTGGITVGGGTGLSNVGITGSNPTAGSVNLFIDGAAVVPSGGVTLSLPSLTTNGGLIYTLAGGGSTNSAYIPNFASLNVAAGNTNFQGQRGSGSRVIYQFQGTTTRSAGGTVNFRDDIANAGTNNVNGGGYRMATGVNVNGIVPFATYTTTSTNTSWFVAVGTGNNGTAYSAFTSSTAASLGTSTQNSTVVTDVALPGDAAATINSIRFNDTTARTVTIDAAAPLTIGAGAILVTNIGTADHLITGGTLMGGAPGSGSGNDLIIHQLNNTSTFTINSVIADNVTPTALTKTGAGTLALGGQSTYTGGTFVNAGTLLVTGAVNGAAPTLVSRGGTLGGTGSVSGAITLNSGGKVAPGVLSGGIESLDGSSLVWNSDNAAAGMAFDLSTTDNTSDLFSLTGALTKGLGNLFFWDLQGGLTGETYTLATFGSTNFAATNFATTGAAGSFNLTANSIQFTVIPEPQSCLLVLGSLGTLALRRRRAAGAI